MPTDNAGAMLLVDAGNSRIKWRLCAPVLSDSGVITPAADDGELQVQLREAWQSIPSPCGIWVASVAAARIDTQLQHATSGLLGREPTFVHSPAYLLGVRSAYRQPAQLGVDRFLAMVAAHHAQPGAQLLISVGTALTVDALAADGVHLGGLIAATPTLARQALLANTARIGVIDGHSAALADNTADAVTTGTRMAALGVITHAREVLRQHSAAEPRLVISGGGMAELLPLLPGAQPHEGLVLDGLALFARQDVPADRQRAGQPR